MANPGGIGGPKRPSYPLYDAMVSAFRTIDRDNPKGITSGSAVQVAKLLNIPIGQVRWAFERGWPASTEVKGHGVLLAIRDVIFRTHVLARSERNKALKALIDTRVEELENATEDSARSRALEGLAVRKQMAIASELTSNTLQLLLASQTMRVSMMQALADLGANPDMPLSKRLTIINALSEIAERDSKTLERAQTLERRFMGEVESRQRVDQQTTQTASPEAVYSDLSALFRALNVGSPKALPAPALESVVELADILAVAEEVPKK